MERLDMSVLQARKKRRLVAHRRTMVFALLLVLAVLALGAYQLHVEGLAQFLFRAPGVGAS